ncbi:MAG: hypothetical protein Q9227_000268 [Pyrenula ochraceoflavens]
MENGLCELPSSSIEDVERMDYEALPDLEMHLPLAHSADSFDCTGWMLHRYIYGRRTPSPEPEPYIPWAFKIGEEVYRKTDPGEEHRPVYTVIGRRWEKDEIWPENRFYELDRIGDSWVGEEAIEQKPKSIIFEVDDRVRIREHPHLYRISEVLHQEFLGAHKRSYKIIPLDTKDPPPEKYYRKEFDGLELVRALLIKLVLKQRKEKPLIKHE